jgi:murein DD-endopeptidase MepM/ murein hydrolase activator NlpD
VKSNFLFRVIGLLALVTSLTPVNNANALVSTAPPPADMFQLPWQQGEAWVALDGFDNGTKRPDDSSHNYENGGALDFTPNKDVKIGDDTSNFWVTAAAAGTVIVLSTCHIKIIHDNGWITEYQHLDNIQVKLGDAVYRNQRLGVIHNNEGEQVCPGNIFPYPHLHFSLRPDMNNATFAGWVINYDSLLNRTTFSKNGQTIETWSFQPILNVPNLQIVLRDPITWDTIYTGSVDAYRYERWPFALTQTQKFTLTATGITVGLTPVIVLLDANGDEIVRGTGTLTSTQPAGNYFVQIQPNSGQGFYNLIMQKDTLPEPDEPYVSTDVTPTTINVGQTALVTVYLGNVPPEGYTSTEFTCTYDAGLVEASNIVVADLFGTDPAVAIFDPQNGSFIVAIAGSNGQKATTSGVVFTFEVTGLQAGQAMIECKARVSKGDNVLTEITSIATNLTILDTVPAPPPLSSPSSPSSPASPSSPSQVSPILAGQVIANKPVTVSLYNANNLLTTSVTANTDGTFSLTAAAGTYTIIATASGFLSAQGSAAITAGETNTKPTVSLIAGDIDGNGVIDPYDAMTIGMSYNTSSPDAANLNADGTINVLDLELLASNYRRSGALGWP